MEKLQNLMESVEDDDLFYKDDYCVRTLEDDLLNWSHLILAHRNLSNALIELDEA